MRDLPGPWCVHGFASRPLSDHNYREPRRLQLRGFFTHHASGVLSVIARALGKLAATASTVPMSLLSQVAPVTFSCPVPHRNSCPCRRVGADLPCERDEEAPGLGGVVSAPSSRRSQQCEEITRGDCDRRSAQAAASAGIRRLISRDSAHLGALSLDLPLIRSFARARSRGKMRARLLAGGRSSGRVPRERSACARSRIDGCARSFSLWRAFAGPVPQTPESLVRVEHVPGRIRGPHPRIG